MEKTQNTGLEYLPYKFTGKEIDEETGLYYYGARYLDPRYSRWISIDPALVEYATGSSKGEGGIYNSVNLNLYHYAGNNPVKYKDPDGKVIETAWDVVSLLTGVASLVADVKAGNVKGAVIDSLGIVADTAAVVLPCIPGGAGVAINAARITGAAANIAGGALSVQDGLENSDYLEAGIGAVQAASGVGQISKAVSAGTKLSNAASSAKSSQKTYQTYTKTNPVTGEVYSGRTSGKGDPFSNIAKRDLNHHMNEKGFGPAKLDKSSSNYQAIRGREQQLIDMNGGAKSMGGTSGNSINGISPNNPKYDIYMNSCNKEFN